MKNVARRLRVSIDTNVFVSSAISAQGPTYSIVAAILRRDVDLVVSRFQRAEVVNVLRRQELQRYFRSPEIRLLVLDYLTATDTYSNGQPTIPVRDPKDAVILATAMAENVDYLITGDEDLLVLAAEPAVAPLKIVTPRQFLEEFEDRNNPESSS